MVSAIDPTKPATGAPASKADQRNNWQAAKDEIEDLQGRIVTIDALRDFGVNPDNTDNSTQLWAMNAELKANRAPFYKIKFPEGTIRYTVSGWLSQLGKIDIYCYGTSFVNERSTGLAGEKYPLHTGDWTQISLDQSIWQSGGVFNSPNAAAGYLVDTVEAGNKAVQFSAGQTIPTLERDDLLIITGLDQQEMIGTPRNMKFFQFVYVDSYDSLTKIVTLRDSLKYRFDSQWPDSNGWGKARIFVCRSDSKPNNYWNDEIICRGATFLPNPNDTSSDNLALFPQKLTLIDVTANNIYIGTGTDHKVIGCTFGSIEFDKMIQRVYCNNLITKEEMREGGFDQGLPWSQASGVEDLVIENSSARQYLANLFPLRSLTLKEINFTPRSDSYSLAIDKEAYPTRVVTVDNCHFSLLSQSSPTPIKVNVLNITCGAGTTGRDIYVSGSSSNLVEALMIGHTYWTRSGKGGRITTITGDGAGNAVFNLDSADTFSPGDILFFMSCSALKITSSTIVGPKRSPISNHPFIFKLPEGRVSRSRETVVLYSDDLLLKSGNHVDCSFITRMFIEEIIIDVSSVSASTATLNIRYNGTSNNQFAQTVINNQVLGVRTINAGGTSGSQSGDTLNNACIGNFLHSITVLPRVGSTIGWDEYDDFELSKFKITITGVVI